MRYFFFLLSLFLPAPGHAATMQYDKVTKQVYVTDHAAGEVYKGDEFDTFVVPGRADAVVWPAPPGCPTGRREWTLANTDTNPPSLMLNPALKFFRCEVVSNAADVNAVTSRTATQFSNVASELTKNPMALAWAHEILDKCNVDGTSKGVDLMTDAECTAARPVAVLLWRGLMLPMAATQAATDALQIQQEAEQFKGEQGW